MIFVETKREAREFEKLEFANFLPIHGDLEQKQREYALSKFKGNGAKFILVGTDVASRGLDVDDIDVVIQMGCRETDSFVHRSGRTARRGKDGTNILFFEKDELKFVLNLEKELNISIDFANSIDDVVESSTEGEHSLGPFVHKMDRHANSKKFVQKMRVDSKGSDQIYQALANPELDNMKRQQYVQFLIDFYLSKTHMKLEPVGYIQGLHNTETYGLSGLEYPDAMDFRDYLRKSNIIAKF